MSVQVPEEGERRPVRVEVRPVTSPDGVASVLLQLEYGYIILTPDQVDDLVTMLTDTAEEVRNG